MKLCKTCGAHMLSCEGVCAECETDNMQLIEGLCSYVSRAHGQCKAPGTVSYISKKKAKHFYCIDHWMARDDKRRCEEIMEKTRDMKHIMIALSARQRKRLIAKPGAAFGSLPRFMQKLNYYKRTKHVTRKT